MLRASLLGVFVVSCTPEPAPVALAPAPAPALALALAHASASARSSRAPVPPGSWPGLYVAVKGGQDSGWWFFAPRPGGAWLLSTLVPDRAKRVAKVTLDPRGDGWSLRPGVGGDASAFLGRSAKDGEPWRLAFAEGNVPQRLDPDTVSLSARLAKGLRLVRLDDRAPVKSRVEDSYTKDAIDVQDGLFTRLEIEQHGEVACYFDALVPWLYHEPGEKRTKRREPAIGPGIRAVPYLLAKTQLPCPVAFDPDGDYESTQLGKDALVTFYVRGGEPLGAVMISYMYAGLFAAPGVTREDVAAMTMVADAARGEQAE